MLSPTNAAPNVERCLMGPRHLDELLDLAADTAPPGFGVARASLATFWRDAMARYRALEDEEAGAADDAPIRPLPRGLQGHTERLLALPGVRHTFDTVPFAFGMVDLDRIVVSQFSLTQAIVDGIQQSLSAEPSPREIAQLCLPLRPPADALRLVYRSAREFVFTADAHDLRLLQARWAPAADGATGHGEGHALGAVALDVGFSTNLLNAVRFNGRVVLNNGHHRAYALRACGVTHAPCLIQACASAAELGEATTSEVVDNADLYFDAARPPLLRDFDDPLLCLPVPMPRLRRQLRLRIEVESRLLAP